MDNQYIAEFKGFSKEEIEEMVRAKYGNFIFEDQGDGTLVCYPTARGQVTMRPLLQAAKERVYREKAKAAAQQQKDRKIRMSIYKVIRELENIIDSKLSDNEKGGIA
ncbi:MAG: hypothetical protein DRH50_16160 [Deltaproteobacteria bacterium]|nr:MAG: hypothetical protein DRH50_16160 [Deltaproteobacteria bacterium]